MADIPNKPITRKEMYLAKIAGQEVQIPDVPITREEAYLDEIAKEGMGTKVIANPDDVAEDVLNKVEIDGEVYSLPSGGGGGSDDYLDLNNKPQVNGVELKGNKSTSDLGIKFEDLPDAPTLGTASAKNVPASGDASSSQVVMGNDSRLTDSRPASDVSSWAKQPTKPTYTASEVGAIPSTDKGANGGVAELDSNGKVPSSQLPSYVDDTIEGYLYNDKWYSDSQHTQEVTGESGKIYVELATNKTYRWSGSTFVEISESLALGETSSTAYRGDRGKVAYDHSQITGNPHGTTAADVGLGNVPNVSTNDQTPTFTEASTRNNIASGEKLSVILGKVQKFFNDLKTVAFSGSFSDLSNKPSINSVELSGNKTTSDLGLQDKLTFDNVPTDGSNNPVKSDGIYDSEKDIYAVMGQMGAKNLIPYPYRQASGTVNRGITFTYDNRGVVTANNTSSATDQPYLVLNYLDFLEKNKEFIMSSGSSTLFCVIYFNNASGQNVNVTKTIIYDDGTEITTTDSFISLYRGTIHQWCKFKVTGGDFAFAAVQVRAQRGSITYNNEKIYPMLRLASDTDDTYQPYAKTNRELTDEIATKTKNFQGTIAEWNQLSTAEKKAYDHASIPDSIDGGVTFPANKVVMTGGGNVEDAVDRITQPGITAERVDISAFNTQSNFYTCPADGYVYIQGASGTAANLKLLFADESSFYTILNTNTDIIPVYVRKGAKVFCTNPTQCYFVAL